LDAFAWARRHGADGVELDVRRTADGVLVVHHDGVVPGVGRISDLAGPDLPWWVPTLADALDACGPVVVDIELKNPPTEPGFDPNQRVAVEVMELLHRRAAGGRTLAAGAPRRSAGALRLATGGPPKAPELGGASRAGLSGQRWFVTSFWPDTLAAASAAASGPATLGLLLFPGLDAAGLVERAVALGCTLLLPSRSDADASVIHSAHEAGLAVAAWTVNDATQLLGAIEAGVDGVITDDVTEVVAARNRWLKSRPAR